MPSPAVFWMIPPPFIEVCRKGLERVERVEKP